MPQPDQTLPYVFDLWFDIKTRSHLTRELQRTADMLAKALEMMHDNGIAPSEDEIVSLSNVQKAISDLSTPSGPDLQVDTPQP